MRADISSIRNEDEYDKAVEEAKRIYAATPKQGTPEDDRLELLLMMINNYEGESKN